MRLIGSAFRRGVLALAVIPFLNPGLVSAEGFAVQDLRSFDPVLEEAFGAGFLHRAQSRRVTLMCPACEDGPIVDLLLGQQADGTEERGRSGETSIRRLEDLCRVIAPTKALARAGVNKVIAAAARDIIGLPS